MQAGTMLQAGYKCQQAYSLPAVTVVHVSAGLLPAGDGRHCPQQQQQPQQWGHCCGLFGAFFC